MKDFYELIANVEQRNSEQRQAYAKMFQPFFNALVAKRQEEEQFTKQKERQKQERIEFNTSLKDYGNKNGLDISDISGEAPIELQSSLFNVKMAEKQRTDNIRNTMQQAGLEKQWNEALAMNPNEDPDIVFGKMLPFIEAKDAEKAAKQLGTSYYNQWKKRVANGEDANAALGDLLTAKQRSDMNYQAALSRSGSGGGSGGGEGGGLTANQLLTNIAKTNELKSKMQGYYAGITYKYSTGDGDAKGNVTVKINPNAQNSRLYARGSDETKRIVTSTKDKNLTSVQYNDNEYIMIGNTVYRAKKKKDEYVLEKAGSGLPDGVKVAMRQAKADYLNAENQYINYPSLLGNGNDELDKLYSDED